MELNYDLILAKIEGTYNTDPTPAAATEAILVQDAKFSVIGNDQARAIPLNFFGELKPLRIGEGLKLTFKTELKGSGTAGTASRYSPLFQACGFTEALTPGVSAIYTPNSTLEGASVAFYYYKGGTLHKLLGGVGSAKFSFKARERILVEWDFTCMYASAHATTITIPTPTHETVSPLLWKAANFTFNGFTPVIDEMTFDLGNVVSKETDGNAANGIKRYFISNRKPKGSMKIEKVALATQDPWALYDGATTAAIVNAPTGSAGNTFSIAVAGVVLDPPDYDARENVIMWNMPFTIHPTVSTGNNEIVITLT